MKLKPSLFVRLLALSVLAHSPVLSRAGGPEEARGPAKVEVRRNAGRFQLYVNNQPFYIKGAGLELGSPERLNEHGGNSFRTWSAENGRQTGTQLLDRALTNGLYVAMGLDVSHERRGFDYNDNGAVDRQFAALSAQVNQLKNHPALLMWVIGNELNFEKNPKVWDAVNNLSKRIHEIDPNHPTTTPLAGFNKETIALVNTRAPDLDFICFQMYSDIVNLPRYLADAAWAKPYIITEWGATGHWECGKTDWGAPLENDSTTKADLYGMRYATVIAADHTLCLGSYVFLWGQKQERTPTWYGMFLSSGEETAAVDAMHHCWTGHWPANRSPRLHGAWLDGKTASQSVRLKAGRTYAARVRASDPDQDPLSYCWTIMAESTARTIGGDAEARPKTLAGLIDSPHQSEIALRAPTVAGPYRLFACVFDDHGHAAHVNIPFYVDVPDQTTPTAAVREPNGSPALP